MPKRRTRTRKVVSRHRRRVVGGRRGGSWAGFKRFMGSANKFLRKTKLISRVGKLASMEGVPYAGTIGSVAGKLGYGRRRTVRRRRRRGKGVSPAGGGVYLAGRGQKKRLTSKPRGIAY